MSHIIKITPPGVKGSSLHSLEKALEKVQKLDQAGKLKEEVTILGAEAIEKSYPQFWAEYARLGGSYEQHIR